MQNSKFAMNATRAIVCGMLLLVSKGRGVAHRLEIMPSLPHFRVAPLVPDLLRNDRFPSAFEEP